MISEMKKRYPLLSVLFLIFWGCLDPLNFFDFNDEETFTEPPIHPFAGTWKVTDYCVYESLNISLDGNCNNQEFIPIFYQAGIPYSTNMWSYLSEGRVITIDENGNAVGGLNFSQSQQNFTASSNWEVWSNFLGEKSDTTTYLSGTCILNDDKNTLELIYDKNALCIRSTSEDWDGSFDVLNGEGIVYSDSIECYDRWIITTHSDFGGITYNDSTYYYQTWVPQYRAKITLTKQ